MQDSIKTSTRVDEIDFLRFLAALSVVFFHYMFRGYAADRSIMPYLILAPFAKYGYLGVELFFMISGFVILMTAARGSVRGFIISRVVRLYPAFWVCCTITFIVTIAIGAPRFSATISQYLVNMTLLSDFVGVRSIDGAYWSLFVEIQFYALVAGILIIGRIHQAQLFLIVWLFASVALEIVKIGPLRTLFLVDYSAFFIAGATCFLIRSQGVSRTRVGLFALCWPWALFGALRGLPEFEKNYNMEISGVIVACMITVFFLAMLVISVKRTDYRGSRRFRVVGALTYPLYLLHENIGFMIFNIAYPIINPHILLWGTIILILGIAHLVNVFVEQRFSLPMKHALNGLANRLRSPSPS